ncbi:two-component hybrid sensor and regulator [Calothrix sp. NIES-2100]|uniref:response regulator n=1 Tax=Calothrix sp. NIES-2100 TaxID=1954172 RepID=UPI000B5F755F|nr:two-component hybrid sensor and regulator [Calothrix sp. NIES-2100]
MISPFSDTARNQDVRILVVEDDYILALNFQEILECLGYTVIDIVDSAEVAIEKANQLQPNLILMNIRLSGAMDGIQAAEIIWQIRRIPIIYITGYSDENILARATQTYPFPYIIKPATKQKIYRAIQSMIIFLFWMWLGFNQSIAIIYKLCIKLKLTVII